MFTYSATIIQQQKQGGVGGEETTILVDLRRREFAGRPPGGAPVGREPPSGCHTRPAASAAARGSSPAVVTAARTPSAALPTALRPQMFVQRPPVFTPAAIQLIRICKMNDCICYPDYILTKDFKVVL